jgi:hypothetical protein
MNTLLVGYDLNRPGQDYDELIEKLKGCPNWWHHLDSTWLIKANLTLEQLRNQLTPFLDKNDESLVADMTGNAAAWKGFTERGSSWIKENL